MDLKELVIPEDSAKKLGELQQEFVPKELQFVA